jgi:hypothetical protein
VLGTTVDVIVPVLIEVVGEGEGEVKKQPSPSIVFILNKTSILNLVGLGLFNIKIS